MTVRVVIIAGLLLLLLLGGLPARALVATKEKQHGLRPWLVNDYPHPDEAELEARDPHQGKSSPLSCRSQSKRFCDPDGILQTTSDLERLDEALRVVVRSQYVCPDAEKDENEKEHGVEVQFAVAFVDKMDLTPFQAEYTHGSHHHSDIESLAAETFGQSIHNKWGVGLHRPQCGGGTGVLIFISRQDRAVYISRGGALEKVLTNDRLQHKIIEQVMKPLLRQGQFAQASIQAINEILYYLHSAGPPSFWEIHSGAIMMLSFISVFASIVLWGEYKNRQDRKRYSQVSRHLNEIDQARAEALQGHFRCRSCPICLEPFQAPPPPTTPPAIAPPKPASASTSAAESESINTSSMDDSSSSSNSKNNENTEQFKLGSDGLPITLLRCGHVFDQTCWLEWVQSGQGQIDKCPICKQHVGEGGGAAVVQNDRQPQAPARNTQLESLLRRRNDTTGRQHRIERNVHHSTIDRDQSTSNRVPEDNNSNSNVRGDTEYFPHQDLQSRQLQRQLLQDRILAMYMVERNFRLARLGHYYPQFVGSEQIQQWTRTSYNGQLARDPAFVRVDPQVRAAAVAAERARKQSNASRGGGHSSGFGGGRSGGGAGGRW